MGPIIGEIPSKSSFREAFMRGEVAEVCSLPTKTSLRELARLFPIVPDCPVFLRDFLLFGAPLPHAPGARMTVVTLTPSNYLIHFL